MAWVEYESSFMSSKRFKYKSMDEARKMAIQIIEDDYTKKKQFHKSTVFIYGSETGQKSIGNVHGLLGADYKPKDYIWQYTDKDGRLNERYIDPHTGKAERNGRRY